MLIGHIRSAAEGAPPLSIPDVQTSELERFCASASLM